jgi:hypothetical protein
MKLDFLKLPPDERRLYIEQAAIQRNISPVIMEKDFFVCWLLGILFKSRFAHSLVFKGGTSLSKIFGAINRFSEDIDLSLSPAFLGLPESAANRSQADKWWGKAEEACERTVQTQIMPTLEASALDVLVKHGQASFEFLKDPQTKSPVILFHYPSSLPTGLTYIKRSVKLEFGSLTDQQPIGRYPIRPWVAEVFPAAFPDWQCEVTALEIERTFWEKATILHAEYHRPLDKPMRDRFSRHYADTAALANHSEAIKAIDYHDLRDRVVSWKNLFFRDSSTNYTLAKPGTFHLVPRTERLSELRRDYQLMRDMYLKEPVNFDDILSILTNLENRINLIEPLPSLGEVLIRRRGDELVQAVTRILNAGANVNDVSWNGHRPLQLLIKALLEPLKKLELVKRMVDLGADIHSADTSGLTPYQVAISEKNKLVSDLLRSKGARPMSPPGTGYAQHHDMYHEIPLP